MKSLKKSTVFISVFSMMLSLAFTTSCGRYTRSTYNGSLTSPPPTGGGSGGGGGGGGGPTNTVIRFAWDANTETDLAGYRVYYGTTTGFYNQAFGSGIDIGLTSDPLNPQTSLTLPAVSGVTYYIVVTAYDSSGNESIASNEVSKAIP